MQPTTARALARCSARDSRSLLRIPTDREAPAAALHGRHRGGLTGRELRSRDSDSARRRGRRQRSRQLPEAGSACDRRQRGLDPHPMMNAGAASLLLLAHVVATAALEGRNAVTQYAWDSLNCSGPIIGVLATYKLNECTESVYPGVYLNITWIMSDNGIPDAIQYHHYADKDCKQFTADSPEGLMSCTSRPAGFPVQGAPTGYSKMMVYGPSDIVMTEYAANPFCDGSPSKSTRCE